MKLSIAVTASLLACAGPTNRSAPGALRAIAPELEPIGVELACDLRQCPSTQCGYNSSELTGFDVDQLNLDGCRGLTGVRLLVDTLVTPGCGAARLRLDVKGGELVATDGVKPCATAQLVGATFWIEAPRWALRGLGPIATGLPEGQIVRQQFEIVAVGATSGLRTYEVTRTGRVLTLDDATATDPDAWYEVGDRRDPQAPIRRHACDASEVTEGQPRAVVFSGDVFRDDASIFRSGEPTWRWFHFACLGSALGTARLRGYDPHSKSSVVEDRQAMLKMLTARYCRAAGGSFTKPGVPLVWQHHDTRDTADHGPIEARWSAEGATCFSHSRLWRSGVQAPLSGLAVRLLPSIDTEDELGAYIRTVCGIPDCDGARDPWYWTSYTSSDHVHHVDDIDVGPAAPR